MHFPKFWVRARRGAVAAWGWSDSSEADALAEGEHRLTALLSRLAEGHRDRRGDYGYPDRPLREEVVREFFDANGSLSAAVTRNRQGCLILNTARAVFVDADTPAPSLWQSLSRAWRPRKDFGQEQIDRVQRWVDAQPEAGWRVYQTKAGLRLLATHTTAPPDGEFCRAAFTAFGGDPLYQRLCTTQGSFRARLTPKPWRCGLKCPPVRWPWPTEEAQATFEAWDIRYRSVSEEFATCRLLGQFGNPEISEALRELVAFHDLTTGAETGRPLA